jgi:uncharacterized membrane protein
MEYENTFQSFFRENGDSGSPSSEQIKAMRPWAAIAAGAALAVFGASRKSWPGAAVAAAGGLLAYQGFRESHKTARPIHVERSFTINKPIEQVFSFWRNFENLPRFMRHLRSVESKGDGRSHWEARAPLGLSISWDAEIIEERENDFILWRSLPGGSVEHRGSVQFRNAPFAGGTEIIVSLDYRPPIGKAGAFFARMFGENPEQQVREDLRRFKQLMEAGEIPTTEGQTSGRRSAFVRMMHAATAERTTMRERTAS